MQKYKNRMQLHYTEYANFQVPFNLFFTKFRYMTLDKKGLLPEGLRFLFH